MNKLWVFVVSLFAVLLDQASKAWIRNNYALGEGFTVVPGVIEFRHTHNTGMAFSLFAEQSGVLTAVVVVVNIALLTYVIMSKRVPLYFGFIVGGALSNLIDRFSYGYVTDFINLLFVDFAVFNVADTCLNIGVALLLIDQFVRFSSKKP